MQEGILKLLMRLQKELNLTYLFITHDISTVKAISDQVVVMNLGQVVEQGKKDDVFSPPHPEYTELLLSSVPEMDPDWLTNLNKAVRQARQEFCRTLIRENPQPAWTGGLLSFRGPVFEFIQNYHHLSK